MSAADPALPRGRAGYHHPRPDRWGTITHAEGVSGAVIIWTVSNGESGAADTRGRAAAEATTATPGLLHTTAPRTVPWDGPRAAAVTVGVDDTDTHLDPCYDRRGHYDPGGTTGAACQLRDELTAALPTATAEIGAPGATRGDGGPTSTQPSGTDGWGPDADDTGGQGVADELDLVEQDQPPGARRCPAAGAGTPGGGGRGPSPRLGRR